MKSLTFLDYSLSWLYPIPNIWWRSPRKWEDWYEVKMELMEEYRTQMLNGTRIPTTAALNPWYVAVTQPTYPELPENPNEIFEYSIPRFFDGPPERLVILPQDSRRTYYSLKARSRRNLELVLLPEAILAATVHIPLTHESEIYAPNRQRLIIHSKDPRAELPTEFIQHLRPTERYRRLRPARFTRLALTSSTEQLVQIAKSYIEYTKTN